MSGVAAVALVFGALVALARWLRVSQREHYLPGSVVVTARRWVTRRPPNAVVVVAWVALAAAGAVEPAAGVVAAVVGAAFPVCMPVLGSPRLRLTRRAAYQGVTALVLTAAAAGAVAVLVDVGPAAGVAPALAAVAVDAAAVVNRPLERRIALRFRRQAEAKLARVRPRVVAITGSYGKTTVKNHVRDLVAGSVNVLATPASWNNEAGLSRAVNEQLTPATEVFVAEMGTYGPGEIRDLVAWVRPEIAVMTAVGPVHLERMKTLEGIAAAKSEILDEARVAVINVDHEQLRAVADRVAADGRAELWRVGTAADAATALDVAVTPAADGAALAVTVRGECIAEVPRGPLHPGNVACAVAAALALGVDRRVLTAALPRLTAPANRAVVATTADGLTVVDDTFNSNPSGAESAVAALTAAVPTGRRAVVTPGMVELGPLQDEANERLAEAVDAAGADLVVVGWTNRRALTAGHRRAVAVRDRDAARQWVRANLGAGDGVLWENDLPDHYP